MNVGRNRWQLNDTNLFDALLFEWKRFTAPEDTANTNGTEARVQTFQDQTIYCERERGCQWTQTHEHRVRTNYGQQQQANATAKPVPFQMKRII